MKLTWIEQIFRQDAEQSSAGRVLKVQRAHLAPQPERAAAPRRPSLRGAFLVLATLYGSPTGSRYREGLVGSAVVDANAARRQLFSGRSMSHPHPHRSSDGPAATIRRPGPGEPQSPGPALTRPRPPVETSRKDSPAGLRELGNRRYRIPICRRIFLRKNKNSVMDFLLVGVRSLSGCRRRRMAAGEDVQPGARGARE